MCNGVELLGEIKQNQALICRANLKCWCMRLQARLPHFDNVCMSPAEILEEHQDILTQSDINYLNILSTRDFLAS